MKHRRRRDKSSESQSEGWPYTEGENWDIYNFDDDDYMDRKNGRLLGILAALVGVTFLLWVIVP